MYKATVYIRGRAKKHHADITAHAAPLTCSKTSMVLGADKGSPLDALMLVGTPRGRDGRRQPDFRWTNTRGVKVIKGTQEKLHE